MNYFTSGMIGGKGKRFKLDGFVKRSNSRRANFVIMRRTYRTLNDYEMQHNVPLN